MELEHTFTVPVPRDRAWDVLLDVERVAPCMPGASLDSVDGDEIHGRIKVKVGPINMVYAGTARFVERDFEAGVVRLDASGKETKGAGTASASIRSVLEDRGQETFVTVLTTLNVTGKPAQFGRGVMNEVSGKLLTMFAANLAATLAEPEEAAGTGQAETAESAGAGGATSGGGATATEVPEMTAAAADGSEHAAANLDAPVDELKLPARVASSLQRDGITTIGQLVAKTDDELLALDGIGPASVDDIKTKIAEHGLNLGQSPAAAPAGTTSGTGTAGTAGTGTTGTGTTSTAGTGTTGTGTTGTGTTGTAGTATPTPAAPSAEPHPTTRQSAHQLEDDAINLFKVAGLPILKRALPVLAGLTAVLLIGLRRFRRGR